MSYIETFPKERNHHQPLVRSKPESPFSRIVRWRVDRRLMVHDVEVRHYD